MITTLEVPRSVVAATLDEVQRAGYDNSERVVLWLGRRAGEHMRVEEMFVPLQEAEVDYFRIPREGMARLLEHLRKTRLMIACQVHSHPELAFHSKADDAWAIVRHEGALSLVVPYFGMHSDVQTFVRDTAVFELTAGNKWVEVLLGEIGSRYKVV
jgi:proteasome lid subunit RPN8/RPN11